MSNPSQKAGNPRRRYKKVKYQKGDYHMKKIARQEAQKVVAKKVESKVHDLSVLAATVDWTASASIFSLTAGLTRGTTNNDFIGDSIMPSHLRIRWAAVCSDTTNLFRVIVIQSKAGGTPIGATLFQSSGSVNTPLSPFDTDYSNTYRVLYDEFYSMVGNHANPPECTSLTQITGDIRLKGDRLKKIDFGAAAATAGDLWLIFVSDSGLPPSPIVQCYSRLYFKDA